MDPLFLSVPSSSPRSLGLAPFFWIYSMNLSVEDILESTMFLNCFWNQYNSVGTSTFQLCSFKCEVFRSWPCAHLKLYIYFPHHFHNSTSTLLDGLVCRLFILFFLNCCDTFSVVHTRVDLLSLWGHAENLSFNLSVYFQKFWSWLFAISYKDIPAIFFNCWLIWIQILASNTYCLFDFISTAM